MVRKGKSAIEKCRERSFLLCRMFHGEHIVVVALMELVPNCSLSISKKKRRREREERKRETALYLYDDTRGP